MKSVAPSGKAIDVSVVIVSWNARDYLRSCLQSVFKESSGLEIEVFVVDNASADDSAEMVRTEFPGVTLISNAFNRGFAAANNQGLALASGRYVLLLNPDTTVMDRAIERTVRIADRDPTIGVLGCQVLLGPNEIQRTCFRFPSVWRIFLDSSSLHGLVPSWVGGSGAMSDWDRRSARDVDVVSGMYMLVPRAVINRVGPMDEDYFVYAEEADWCFRIWKAGWRCHFSPAARIIHHEGGGKSSSKARVKMYVQLQKSLLIFLRKNRGWRSWLAAKAVYLLCMSGRAVAWRMHTLTSDDGASENTRCAAAALRFHLFGTPPTE